MFGVLHLLFPNIVSKYCFQIFGNIDYYKQRHALIMPRRAHNKTWLLEDADISYIDAPVENIRWSI
jgi:hypothetical protein